MKLLKLVVILTGVVFARDTASAQVTSNVLYRVFLIKYKSTTGTAFTIDVDGRQYLVTARHVVPGIGDQDKISIFHENKWKPMMVKPIRVTPKEVDIIVLIPPQQLSPTLQMEPTMGGLVIAQPVYFLGFPYKMYTDVGDLMHGFPLPFVKGGILSALDARKDKGYSILYVDGLNNPGFSGGPVVFKDLKSKEMRVAGVISSYKNHPDIVVNRNLKTGLTALSNSGILIAYGIAPAVEAIKARPEGPVVKPATDGSGKNTADQK